MAPFFSILMVNYNGLKHLEECFHSINSQSFNDYEIVFVDNNSHDDSISWVKTNYPKTNTIQSTANLGFAGGNNFGLPHCKGKYIFFLNNDTALEKTALQELYNIISRNPTVNIYAGLMIDYSNHSITDNGGDTLYTSGMPFSYHKFPVSHFTKERLIASACGGACVYARETLEKIGYFDEDFFLNLEDLDLSLRAHHYGEKILFTPNVKIYHKGSATFGGRYSKTYTYYSERNHLWCLLKTVPFPYILGMLPTIYLLKLMRLIKLVPKGLFFTFIKANWDSLFLIKKMLIKRRLILKKSTATPKEFGALLRKGWITERIKSYLKKPNITP